jgi:hypothetical protein
MPIASAVALSQALQFPQGPQTAVQAATAPAIYA